jgi:hypothetical protein
MVTRNLSLRERLPAGAHVAGYSWQYAVQGAGYSLSAVFAGLALDRSTPSLAILAGVGITVLLAGVSAAVEQRIPPVHRMTGAQGAADRSS